MNIKHYLGNKTFAIKIKSKILFKLIIKISIQICYSDLITHIILTVTDRKL